MQFRKGRALAVVFVWPDGMCRPELIEWLQYMGVYPAQRIYVCERDIIRAYNIGMHEALRRYKPEFHDQFIFADNDIVPSGGFKAWVECDADVVGVKYPTNNEHAWGQPDVFHTGLYRIDVRALNDIAPPFFQFVYDGTGRRIEQCACLYFREKLLAAGRTIAVAGTADHRVK